MFWLFAAALTLIAALAILWPFWRARSGPVEPAAAYDLRVYQDQLAEIDRDLARGIIDPADAERLRTEIGRKVLGADKALARDAAAGPVTARHRVIATAVLVALIAAGGALYLRIGTPGQPDMALTTRIASAEARYASRPSQAEAEAAMAALPAPALPAPDADFMQLMDQLRAAVQQRPDDVKGLTLLARNEARLGNALAAKTAQAHLVEVRGADATAEDHAFLAGLMTEAAGGVITPEAEREIAVALQLDPRNAQARYMTGLLQAQNGRPDRAFPVWVALLEETPAESPWNIAIRQVIGDIAWLAGRPEYIPPQPTDTNAAPTMPGPDADQMAAAGDMTPEERQEFVRSMVDRLESRLATEGGTAAEWGRLISSLTVVGEHDRAREIAAEARTRFADDPASLAEFNEAAEAVGIGP
ncbi:c-type cytochrome biogenesis protein CcmI [Paracoccus xiamenensis]|uniref:c-type cytochrome biogenesis protein CcmI n=1 Tax=Paracoccus xiamenensis TaxID=2714901 RepID=UPI001407D7B4|nr:c-type cytochrome biogenesis protein CcmI [Paracoccus xiamenensis]NHF74126.1 c-type cytochrome biogenesis protein CcmI [Paracoccus xiamenensis]